MSETIAFTPEWLKPKEGEPDRPAPVFHLRLASILERDQFEAEIEGVYRAGEVPQFQLRDIVIEGLRALAGEDAEALEQLVLAQYGGESLSADELTQMKAAFDILAEHWPEYRVAREQEARRNRVLPTLAFQRWCTGWENVVDDDDQPVEFERVKGVIPDRALRRVQPIVLRIAGLEAWRIQYGKSDLKN